MSRSAKIACSALNLKMQHQIIAGQGCCFMRKTKMQATERTFFESVAVGEKRNIFFSFIAAPLAHNAAIAFLPSGLIALVLLYALFCTTDTISAAEDKIPVLKPLYCF